jgi:translation initiation factor 2D
VTDQIIADYGIEIPKNEPAENQDEEQAGSGGIGLLRNSLLPEGALSARFSTTVGADLKTVNGTVYAGSHPDEEMRILWIKLDEKIIPSGIMAGTDSLAYRSADTGL